MIENCGFVNFVNIGFLKQAYSLSEEVILDWNGEVFVVKIPVKE